MHTASSLCPMRFAYFNPSRFNIGDDDSGKGWHNLLVGITQTKSKDFNAKVEISASNFLYCQGKKECDLVSGFGQDLAARNIQRGRDHGIPNYLEFRKFCNNNCNCNLAIPKDFDDKPDDIIQEHWDNLKSVYNSVDDIDAFSGGVSEKNLAEPGKDGLVGKTFACIIGQQFVNLKKGDRFFFTHEANGANGEQGLDTAIKESIRKRTLGDIICDNIHGLQKVPKNVFKSNSNDFECKSTNQVTLP